MDFKNKKIAESVRKWWEIVVKSTQYCHVPLRPPLLLVDIKESIYIVIVKI